MRIERTLPPVGYRFSVGDLSRCALRMLALSQRGAEPLEREICDYLGVQRAFAVSSGKAALTLTLEALHGLTGRRRVILPAYTCYSLPSAIVKAGLEVVPCDMAPGSFDYDYERLRPLLTDDVLCVLSVHLFGIPSDTARLHQLCVDRGILVVEDAAQAFGCSDAGQMLGTRGDVGFYSLGRGKNITCGSGGVVVTNSEEIASALAERVRACPVNGVRENLASFVSLFLLSMFISPALYWFPAGLPFLKLGETIFHEDFPVRRLSGFEASLMRGWRERLASLNAVRQSHGKYYAEHVEGLAGSRRDVSYLRFPVLIASEPRRTTVLREGRVLGVSGMYPSPVTRIPQLQGRLQDVKTPEADRVARMLVTLPTHPLLSSSDRSRICDVVNRTTESSLAPQAAVAS